LNPENRLELGGISVARIGLGTNRLTNSRDGIEFIKQAVDAGVDVVDTAHTYTGGQSEETIGAALSLASTQHVVATKGGYARGHGRPEVLQAQVAESLRRLRADSIPLYYLHRVDPETPLEESLEAIKENQRNGRIRHVGLSQVGIEEIERGRKIVPIAAVQNHYNISERGYDDVVDYCEREGIVFVPYYPLGGRWDHEVDDLAARHHATPAQIALAWLLKRSPAMLPIPGTLSLEHVRENVAALDIELSDREFRAPL
jgi:pyridoxine 4-dehydrogenase